MVKVQDVAKYFLKIQDPEDTITNMKLQKLLYLAQGFHLAIYGKRLFKSDIKAWDHGPVVPTIYHEYKKYYKDPIPVDASFDASMIDRKVQGLLDEVYNVFGIYSAYELRNLTHQDSAWKKAFNSENSTISDKDMTDCFKKRIR